jgi:hypothetical protein
MTTTDLESMYKLEITQAQIDAACEANFVNNSIDDTSVPENEAFREDARNLITEFAQKIEVFYDDDADRFAEKNAREHSHRWYDIIVKRGDDFYLQTCIALPRNPLSYREFDLQAVIEALSFEVVDLDALDNAPEEGSFEYARHVLNNQKIYDEFGTQFYIDILGGSV